MGTDTAKGLARLGATVLLVGCEEMLAEEARAKIVKELRAAGGVKSPADLELRVHVEILDLQNMQSVREFVKQFMKSYRPLDILINGANRLCMFLLN